MRFKLVLIIILVPFFSYAQEISNIHFEQVGNQIHIYYDLEGEQQYNVQVYCSTDSGKTWGEPLQYVTGEVGEDQNSGKNKEITWEVLKETNELSGDIRFRIVAIPKIEKSKPNDFSGKAGTFIDNRDGQEYKWVKIGIQIWMAENLNVGKRIHHKSNPLINNIIEKFCYDNIEANCTKYGGLYLWEEAVVESSTQAGQGICPNGWHIPSKEEWGDLILAIDNSLSIDKKELAKQMKKESGAEGIVASNFLKSKSEWEKETSGIDSYGFRVLPAGKINFSPTRCEHLGRAAFFWTSTNENKRYAWIRILNQKSEVNSAIMFKKEAASVRCIKN